MKKSILLLALCLSLGLVFTSCKGEKKEGAETTESHAAEKADMAMVDVYQCPMDCEKGKTYEEEGKCPVCEMALKKVEKEEEGTHTHDNGETHESHDKDADGGDKGNGEKKSDHGHEH